MKESEDIKKLEFFVFYMHIPRYLRTFGILYFSLSTIYLVLVKLPGTLSVVL